MFGIDTKAGIVAFILWLGIMATPSAVGAGLVIALIVYSVSVLLMGKRPGWRIVIGFGLTILLAIGLVLIAPGLPYLAAMPIQGVMGLAGIVSALIYPKRHPDKEPSWLEMVVKKAIQDRINKLLK